MTKKILSLGMAVMMLLSLSVAASAAPWDETVNDGFTDVLLSDAVEGIVGGTDLISDPTFTAITSSEWQTGGNAPSKVSADDEKLADAAAHGDVIKTVSTSTSEVAARTAKGGVALDTHNVVQVDMYLDDISSGGSVMIKQHYTELFAVKFDGTEYSVNAGNTGDMEVSTTIPTKQWVTVTLDYSTTTEKGEQTSLNVWINDTLVKEDAKISAMTSDYTHIRLATKNATAYWDNFQVWNGADVVGSPVAENAIVNQYASVVASPVADDGHGLVMALRIGTKATDFNEIGNLPADADTNLIKYEMDFRPHEIGTIRFGIPDSTGKLQYNSSIGYDEENPGAWYHVVMYVDAVNDTYTTYVNGTLKENVKADYDIVTPTSMNLRVYNATEAKPDTNQYVHVDNLKISVPEYTDNFATVSYKESCYKLAYKLDSAFSNSAVLIAAVKEGNTLANVDIAASKALASGESEVLVADYTLTEGQTLSKYLWKDLTTLVPLLDAE